MCVDELQRQVEDNKDIKKRFEELEKSQPPEYEQVLATTKKQLAAAKKDAINTRNDLVRAKKANEIYKAYTEGQFNKDALEDQLASINAIGNAFDVKLKRIKVTQKKRAVVPSSPLHKPLSIKELQDKYNKAGTQSTNN